MISTWKSIEDWNNWANSSERKAFEQKTAPILEEPTKVTPYKYEFFSVNVDKEPAGLEFSVEGE